MRFAALSAIGALLASSLGAQDLHPPQNWQIRFDRPGAVDSTLWYVEMPPGWHITTGPAGIFYHASWQARGRFRIETEIFLFPAERPEGFGVFVGGQGLDRDDQSYLYFLLRKDGRYLVKHRAGRETHILVPWTEHAAIVKHDGGEGTAKNVLAIEAEQDSVRFFVNGDAVTSLARAGLDVSGTVGLRVNHGLNLHITDLRVEQRYGARE